MYLKLYSIAQNINLSLYWKEYIKRKRKEHIVDIKQHIIFKKYIIQHCIDIVLPSF